MDNHFRVHPVSSMRVRMWRNMIYMRMRLISLVDFVGVGKIRPVKCGHSHRQWFVFIEQVSSIHRVVCNNDMLRSLRLAAVTLLPLLFTLSALASPLLYKR